MVGGGEGKSGGWADRRGVWIVERWVKEVQEGMEHRGRGERGEAGRIERWGYRERIGSVKEQMGGGERR